VTALFALNLGAFEALKTSQKWLKLRVGALKRGLKIGTCVPSGRAAARPMLASILRREKQTGSTG
jgi:hypothetical protein